MRVAITGICAAIIREIIISAKLLSATGKYTPPSRRDGAVALMSVATFARQTKAPPAHAYHSYWRDWAGAPETARSRRQGEIR